MPWRGRPTSSRNLCSRRLTFDGSTGVPLGVVNTRSRSSHRPPTRDGAVALMRDLVPVPTVARTKEHLRVAGERGLSYGITSVGEAAISSSARLAAYQEPARDGELPVRVFTMMLIDDMLEPMERLGLRTGFGDEWLRIGPAKVSQDGSGGGRTAAMTVAYRNDPGRRGTTIYDQAGLDERFTSEGGRSDHPSPRRRSAPDRAPRDLHARAASVHLPGPCLDRPRHRRRRQLGRTGRLGRPDRPRPRPARSLRMGCTRFGQS